MEQNVSFTRQLQVFCRKSRLIAWEDRIIEIGRISE